MPQMAPLNWVSLFILFTVIFLITNSLNYFSFSYKTPKLFISKIKKSINWKW